jgi:hypothetical protein
MIVAQGGFASDAIETFRSDEVVDINGNGAPEFADGWGRPIGFIRWPAGLTSPMQTCDATREPDPFDPMRVSGDYLLTPLIFSGGPDEATNDPLAGDNGYGIKTSGQSWIIGEVGQPDGWLATTRRGAPSEMAGTATAAAADNITNHDLMSKR